MGTRSSLENFNSKRTTEYSTRINRPPMQSTLQTIHSSEKALSMNSLNEQSDDSHHRNGSVCSTDSSPSNSESQPSRPQRPRSAPGNQSADSNTISRTQGVQLHVPSLDANGLPETRRMAVCEANDEAEKARTRMRVYKKRF
ncbi:uncharacterized protein LOC116305868 [Actinia tenebrosa]|uniref:Uncharacterized protein LOC116305868 n=1 Tax=Actinia tenebrosa TaxID=6105 RepID=A0A6P8IX83_ACTTE|nr:uncharacterized protein LOC116305868 [Actinia tenebrosa]